MSRRLKYLFIALTFAFLAFLLIPAFNAAIQGGHP